MSSRKIKSSTYRKHRTNTPYVRKGVLQTVKDWLTPSKWTNPWEEDTNEHDPDPIHEGNDNVIESDNIPGPSTDMDEVPPARTPDFSGLPDPASFMRYKQKRPHESTETTRTPPEFNGLPDPASYMRYKQKPQPISTEATPTVTSERGQMVTSTPCMSSDEFMRHVDTPRPPINTKMTTRQVLSGAPSSNRPSFSVSTFHTPISNNMTGLSLSRSPFFSPFYSGRTVYGGVSNKNTNLFRNKRARVDTATTEEPPPHVNQVIRPRPSSKVSQDEPTTSETARKILKTLHSISSPLHDARKLPLRVQSPAKRARLDKPFTTVKSPPPIAPLSIVPAQPTVSNVKQPLVPKISTNNKDKPLIIDLTQSPPTNSLSKRGLPPISPSAAGGKMRTKRHSTHYSKKTQDTDEQAPPPSYLSNPVPLVLPTSITSISLPNVTAPAIKITSMSCPPPDPTASFSLSTPSPFTFTSPTPVTATKTALKTTPTPNKGDRFAFSAPKIVDDSNTSKRDNFDTITEKDPPPLKMSGSVLDALKLPEYNIENIRKEKRGSTTKPTQDNNKAVTMETMHTTLTSPAKSSQSNIGLLSTGISTTSASGLKLTSTLVSGSGMSLGSTSLKPLSSGISLGTGTNSSMGISLSTTTASTGISLGTKAISMGISLGAGTTSSMGISLSTTTTHSTGISLSTGKSNTGISLSKATTSSSGINLGTTSSTGISLGATSSMGISLGATSSTGISLGTTSSTGISLGATSSTGISLGTTSSTGISLGTTSSTGISLSGSKPTSSVSPLSIPSSSDKWECEDCYASNPSDKTNCLCCNAPNKKLKTNLKPLKTSAAVSSTWECPSCMLINKADMLTCPACSEKKPGAAVSTGKAGLSTTGQSSLLAVDSKAGGLKLTGQAAILGGVSSVGQVPLGSSGGLKLGGLASAGGIKIGGDSGSGLKIGGEMTGLKSGEGSFGFKIGESAAGIKIGGEGNTILSGALKLGVTSTSSSSGDSKGLLTASVPSLGSKVPSSGSNVPNLGLSAPNLGSNALGLSSNIPSLGSTASSLGCNIPSLGSNIPSLGSTASSLGSNIPSLGSNAPTLGLPPPQSGSTGLKIGESLCIPKTSSSVEGPSMNSGVNIFGQSNTNPSVGLNITTSSSVLGPLPTLSPLATSKQTAMPALVGNVPSMKLPALSKMQSTGMPPASGGLSIPKPDLSSQSFSFVPPPKVSTCMTASTTVAAAPSQPPVPTVSFSFNPQPSSTKTISSSMFAIPSTAGSSNSAGQPKQQSFFTNSSSTSGGPNNLLFGQGTVPSTATPSFTGLGNVFTSSSNSLFNPSAASKSQFPTLSTASGSMTGSCNTTNASQQGFNFNAFTSSAPTLNFGGNNATKPQGPMIFGSGGPSMPPQPAQSSQLFQFGSGDNQTQQQQSAATFQFNPGKTSNKTISTSTGRTIIKGKRRLK